MRVGLTIAWWLLPIALALSAWFLHRLGDRQGVKLIAGFGIAIGVGFVGVIAASFLFGAMFARHGNASLSVALSSTLGCVFTPGLPNFRYYCAWPNWQFALLPALYLVLVLTVVRRGWRQRDRTGASTALFARLFSRNALTFVARRFLWPAIPIAFMGFILGNSPDLDPIKPLLVFLVIPLLFAAGLLLVALFARWFRALPGLIGALLVLLLSIYLLFGLVIASFAPHGPDISMASVTRFQTVALALAYVALVLLGFAISAIRKIRNAAIPEQDNPSP